MRALTFCAVPRTLVSILGPMAPQKRPQPSKCTSGSAHALSTTPARRPPTLMAFPCRPRAKKLVIPQSPNHRHIRYNTLCAPGSTARASRRAQRRLRAACAQWRESPTLCCNAAPRLPPWKCPAPLRSPSPAPLCAGELPSATAYQFVVQRCAKKRAECRASPPVPPSWPVPHWRVGVAAGRRHRHHARRRDRSAAADTPLLGGQLDELTKLLTSPALHDDAT